MQRESNVQTLNWADKTMSVLRLQQLEALRKAIVRLPELRLVFRL